MKFTKGEIYRVIDKGNSNIFMWGDTDASHYIGGERSTYGTYGGNFMNCGAVEATYVEKEWLLACMRRGRYIKFENLKIPSYELY